MTIVEKSTSMIVMETLDSGKRPKELAKAVVRLLFPFKNLIKSITTDNGTEFSEHKYISSKLNTIVCFADPHTLHSKREQERLLSR